MEMRIAVIAPVWIPIPPEGYGGIERMLKLLVDELVELGHEITLFASGGSRTSGQHRIYCVDPPTHHMGETLYDAYHVGQAFGDISKGGFDVVHDNSGFLGPAFARFLPLPVVHTLHGPFTAEVTMFYSAFGDDCFYVAISQSQKNRCAGLNYLGVVYNAVDIEQNRYLGEKEDYLVHISRICEDKGTEIAVRMAKEKGWRLLLGGKIDSGRDREYFELKVRPFVDGEQIVYLGEVGQDEKVRIVSRARAFIFPIQWEEPFGLVMAESLACGTPVLALKRGAAPEVVEHGRTGFLADTLEELCGYQARISELEPEVCRKEAETRFSPRTMAESYLSIYSRAIELFHSRMKLDRLQPV
jgi:glycosyltransferase involved in cell wall biosynthesis